MPDEKHIQYLKDHHEEESIETYLIKVWGYDADDEEWEVTDYSNLTLDDLLAVNDLLEKRRAAR